MVDELVERGTEEINTIYRCRRCGKMFSAKIPPSTYYYYTVIKDPSLNGNFPAYKFHHCSLYDPEEMSENWIDDMDLDLLGVADLIAVKVEGVVNKNDPRVNHGGESNGAGKRSSINV
jgi:hypothetical protein